MKKNQETLIPETDKTNLPIRPRSLRPAPSLSGSKSLKPKSLTVRPVKVIKGPVVG
ncbi:MAG: hypothetical protein WDA09_11710 [Bacteriovoracaceae bacterium]